MQVMIVCHKKSNQNLTRKKKLNKIRRVNLSYSFRIPLVTLIMTVAMSAKQLSNQNYLNGRSKFTKFARRILKVLIALQPKI